MTNTDQTITTLHHLLDYDARQFSCAEIELTKHLQQWINKADSLKLKTVLQKYADFAQEHVKKFESFFEAEEINSLRCTNKVMLAFIEDTSEKLTLCDDAAIKDACLLAGVQAINHFKISTYGTAAAFARELGMEEQAAIFHEAEVSEKQIDDRLSQLAEHEINRRAKTPIVLEG